MKKLIFLSLFFIFFLSFPTIATEMSGGDYSIELSATTSGGGKIEEADSQFSLWGVLSQPTSVGKISGSGSEHLFAGVYTAVIPEPVFFTAIVLFSFFFFRKKVYRM